MTADARVSPAGKPRDPRKLVGSGLAPRCLAVAEQQRRGEEIIARIRDLSARLELRATSHRSRGD